VEFWHRTDETGRVGIEAVGFISSSGSQWVGATPQACQTRPGEWFIKVQVPREQFDESWRYDAQGDLPQHLVDIFEVPNEVLNAQRDSFIYVRARDVLGNSQP
jgi:hypothetical protein